MVTGSVLKAGSSRALLITFALLIALGKLDSVQQESILPDLQPGGKSLFTLDPGKLPFVFWAAVII